MTSSRQKELHSLLNTSVLHYETADFIAADPISFAHRYQNDPKACEMIAFLSAMFSYGQRELILKTIDTITTPMQNDPMGFLENFSAQTDGPKLYKNFVYRFNRSEDIVFLLERLQAIYQSHGTLESFFVDSHEQTLAGQIASFTDRLLDPAPQKLRQRYGMKFLFAHPQRGAACKRFHMFLRWMVRKGPVDLGLWQNSLSPSQLLMPMDTHVCTLSRELGLLKRATTDWKAAEELTGEFRRMSPEDPVRYDFALFGLGISRKNSRKLSEKTNGTLVKEPV